MKLKARPGRASPFKTSAGETAFQRFVARDGPLGRIFQDPSLRLAPAKGAREYRDRAEYARVYEQTYFAHALNVGLTAAILFEGADIDADREPEEREIRIILAAGVLHDANKLPFAGGRSLAKTFAECRAPVRALTDGFVDEKEFEGAVGLAVSVEEGTSREAADYALDVFAPRRGSRARLCLNLADRLVGTFADPNDAEGYAVEVARFRAEHRDFPEIRVQGFTLVPQAALARAARQAFLDWVRKHGTLLHETERYASWIGPAPTDDDLSQTARSLSESLARISPVTAFRMSGLSRNRSSVSTEWTRFFVPTTGIVDTWIEWGGRGLLVWQGAKAWADQNSAALQKEFSGVFKVDPRTKRLDIAVPEEDTSRGETHGRARRLAKLVLAHTIIQFLSAERTSPSAHHAPFEASELRSGMISTVPGIIWAWVQRDEPDAYEKTLASLVKMLDARRQEPPAFDAFLKNLLGEHSPLVAGGSDSMCVYCGAAALSPAKDALFFGINVTNWTPRKKGIQKSDAHGVICDLCIWENFLRTAATADSFDSQATYLTAHIHAADLTCNVNWEDLAPLFDTTRAGDDNMIKLIFTGKRKLDDGTEVNTSQLVPLRSHVSVPVTKPVASKRTKTSETQAQLVRLRDFLAFVRDTGFKLHISPLALTPVQERAQFRWTNAPPWMEALGLAEVHVDELHEGARHNGAFEQSAAQVVDALLTVGWIPVEGKRPRAAHTQLVASLQLDPLSIFSFRNNPTEAVDTLGGRFMPPDQQNRLGDIASRYKRFNEEKKWAEQSNAHWTWATRTALDVMEGADPTLTAAELRDHVVGAVWRQAERKNPYAKHEDVERFVDAFTDLIHATNDGRVPIGARRRWLIDAIRYRCQKEYLNSVPQTPKQAQVVTS